MAQPAPFSYEVAHSDGAGPSLVLVGDLDMFAAPQVGKAAAALPDGEIVVDLRRVTFLDSSGLAELLALANERRVIFRRGSPSIQKVFEVTDMSTHVTWSDETV